MAQTLGSVAVGTVVKINENGSPVNYLVVHQGLPSSMYDASCDGTWVLRNEAYESIRWNTSGVNSLPGSNILNSISAMLSIYDSFIQESIKTVKIPYCVGGGSSNILSGSNGLQCKIFPLSAYEAGATQNISQYIPQDGGKLDYFLSGDSTDANNKRIVYKSGTARNWATRSPSTQNSEDIVNVMTSGGFNYPSARATNMYSVPCFILPQNLYVGDDGTILINPPSSITVPSIAMQTQPITVSWSSVSGADSYILQRKANSGEWTQVYAGSDTTFTDTAGSWSTVQYQVCGVFDGVNGAFAQSDVITVLPASALVISGTDGNLGTITSDIHYSVATDTGNQISLTRTVNGALVASLKVDGGFAYNIPVMDLPTGTGTIVITATVQSSSGPVTVKRTWTYTKQAVQFPGSGGVAQLSQDGQNVFPMTLAEAVKAIGGPWGGNLSSALNKLARAATYQPAGDFYDLWGNVIPTVKIETGSYVGTGAYGSSNPNTLTFSFEPKVVFITGFWASLNNEDGNTVAILTDTTGVIPIPTAETGSVVVTIEGSKMEWYSTRLISSYAGSQQGNRNGYTYNYVAIG